MMWMGALVGLAAAVLPSDTTVIGTQSQSWSVQVSYAHEWVTQSDVDRSRSGLRIGRRLGPGALYLDAERIEDFSGTGRGFGAEVHTPLWYHAEGYVRVAGARDALSHPDLLVAGEALQHLGGGWSLGAGGEYRDYAPAETLTRVHLTGGRRKGAWQVRGRAGLVSSDEDLLPQGDLMVRRLTGGRGGYVEVAVSGREEVLDFLPRAGGSVLLTTPTAQLMGGALIALSDALSLQLTSSYSAMEDFGGRAEAGAGLVVRW